MLSKHSFELLLTNIWQELGWDPSKKQLDQFFKLQKIIINLNSTVNLTRLIKNEEYWINHVFDSLWPIKEELNKPYNFPKCIDVGSGCGFPGLAIAIALPNSKVVLVDAIKKKTSALERIVNELKLSSRVFVCTERIEVLGREALFREKFDLAMARAVGSPTVTAEYLVPLIKLEGKALLYRGNWNALDERLLNKALIMLGAKINMIKNIELPANKGIRHLISIAKTTPCPIKYPRNIGIPSKRPLGD